MLKTILSLVVLYSCSLYAGAMEETSLNPCTKETWLAHLPSAQQEVIRTINTTSKRKLTPSPDLQTQYGFSFELTAMDKRTLIKVAQEASKRSPNNPYIVHTYGCGENVLFELNALAAGLSKEGPRVYIRFSDVQESVVKTASQRLNIGLNLLRGAKGFPVPENNTLFQSSVKRIPGDMDGEHYTDGQADMVYAQCVIHFLKPQEIKEFFSKAYKRLNSKGHLVIGTEAPSDNEAIVAFYDKQFKNRDSDTGFMTLKDNSFKIQIKEEFLKAIQNFSEFIPLFEQLTQGTYTVLTNPKKPEKEDFPGKVSYPFGTDPFVYTIGQDKDIDRILQPNAGLLRLGTVSECIMRNREVICMFLDLPLLRIFMKESRFKVTTSLYHKRNDDSLHEQSTITRKNLKEAAYYSYIIGQKD